MQKAADLATRAASCSLRVSRRTELLELSIYHVRTCMHTLFFVLLHSCSSIAVTPFLDDRYAVSGWPSRRVWMAVT
eukprot:6213620-Pleurochrysis_carterae.AAC.5